MFLVTNSKCQKKNRIKINEIENKCTVEKIQNVETGCLGNNKIIRTLGETSWTRKGKFQILFRLLDSQDGFQPRGDT